MNVELWWAGEEKFRRVTLARKSSRRVVREAALRIAVDADTAAAARRDSTVPAPLYPGLFTSLSVPSAAGFGGRPGAVSRLRVAHSHRQILTPRRDGWLRQLAVAKTHHG
ncbi:hypothetical protein ALC60_00452 [Trachymyrmex zeteki]|uniref:Uncharacterized protein n=1 Tax=Mycetomoellerius zeteki TaxID=64791 RepID=A0A151XJA4_9HYME|nr:hypothetical protein ALC60_00452 [Trachymyrmex zeteki]